MPYQPILDPTLFSPTLTWQEAQPFCNFVLFKPQHLSKKFEVSAATLRAESSTDFASYRFTITSKSLKFTVKQFLYDWAPPAYDHPSLWRNAKISPQELTPKPRPLCLNDHIAWVGLNFRRQQAASFYFFRTMIEITVTEGSATDDDFREIITCLQPVDTVKMEEISQTPFAFLTQANRHKRSASSVPLSYWKYTRAESCQFTPLASGVFFQHAPQKICDDYHLNSIFLTGKVNNPIEIEYYFEHEKYPGASIRLLSTQKNSSWPIPFPPELGDQSCSHDTLFIEKYTLYYAYLTEEFGPHEAIWEHNGVVYLLLIKPMSWTTKPWFLEKLPSILKIE